MKRPEMAFQLKGHISSPCAPSRSEMRQLGSSSPPVVCRHSCVAAFKFHAAARAISYECRIRRGEGKMGHKFSGKRPSPSLSFLLVHIITATVATFMAEKAH